MFEFASVRGSCHLIVQSVQPLITGLTVRGSNPGRVKFSAPVQTGPAADPASYTMGTGLSRGGGGGEGGGGEGVDTPPFLVGR